MKTTFVLFFLLTFQIFPNGIKEKTEAVIFSQFGKDVEIKILKYVIPAEEKLRIETETGQRFFRDNILVWEIIKDSSIFKIGIMDNVYGKSQPITFFIILNLDGSIKSNHIIKYREEHGGQIQNPEWNQKFIGLKKADEIAKIDGISGATISVKAIKLGVQKLLSIFPIVKSALFSNNNSIQELK